MMLLVRSYGGVFSTSLGLVMGITERIAPVLHYCVLSPHADVVRESGYTLGSLMSRSIPQGGCRIFHPLSFC